ncbi:hypothetical protein QBC42DRAFT_289137 [Cladorrhinum samala]|uniref:Uncharacterized protein n=1 Tax=Cladorrhinum samala TaxID=585594 RepID=A0AAV9HHB8_9PEZI|nr:hypothetical protein QBC42DRAFT_289137 [Cladorrhinum samala]
MSNPTDKTELQRLEEERDALLACLAVCKAAQARVDEALTLPDAITEEGPHSTPKDDKRVVSSLSDTGSKVDPGDTANPSQPTNLAHRQRKNPPIAKGHNQRGGRMDGRENSAAKSERGSREDSFVMVENLDEGDPDPDEGGN